MHHPIFCNSYKECAAQARQPCIFELGANAESRNVVGIAIVFEQGQRPCAEAFIYKPSTPALGMQKELRFRLSTEGMLNDVDVETKDYRERVTVRDRVFVEIAQEREVQNVWLVYYRQRKWATRFLLVFQPQVQ